MDKERLEQCSTNKYLKADDLRFGRKMPFGKYKGEYVYYLLAAHPFYMKWIAKNTNFKFTETELWWQDKVDTALMLARVDNLIFGLSQRMNLGGSDIENPHWIVE